MTRLTEYLPPETFQHLQDIITHVTHAPMRIYDAQGEAVTHPSEPGLGSSGQAYSLPDMAELTITDPDRPIEAAIVVAGEALGRLVMERPSRPRWPAEQMAALATALNISNSDLRRALQNVPEIDVATSLSTLQLLRLTSGLISRLCEQEEQIRDRVQELTTLYRLTALFTGQRELQTVLNSVAQTVVTVLKVKACSIRLLNSETNELTVQAVTNLSETYLSKGPVPLTESRLDSEALATGQMVHVADERDDPRVLYPNDARKEGLVSALIAPLIYQGRNVGALHLYTGEPHVFSEFETALVGSITAQAGAAIVNAQLYSESLEAERMRRQLRLAGEIQRRMIPADSPKSPRLDIAAIYVPSLEVSGDFYDFIELPKGNLGLTICDVMGKGISASLLMASIRASLRAHVGYLYNLSDALVSVNRSVCQDTPSGDFATLFYGVIDTETMDLTYANAGHEPPVLFRDGQVSYLTTGGTVLGIEPDMKYAHAVVGLKAGDLLALFTDGLSETLDFQNNAFGRERVAKAIQFALARGDDAKGIGQHVLWELRCFAGLRTRQDDLTLLIVRVLK